MLFTALSVTAYPRNLFYTEYFRTCTLHPCAQYAQPPPTANHISCSKATIWRAIIFKFLWPTAITSLDVYNIRYSQQSAVSAPLIVIITLASIWRAYFDATTFEVKAVKANIQADVFKRISKDQVHSLL
ncbi:hypothetical protein [Parasitella parasitica]|uniref:Uncharacterized protein n=1 Tax=Parasitella parasitica TaxID=35722 RepID=A0A0B7N2V9_9FUNG|nr:hypothetical protein [Parasitella parasitica]